MPSPRGTEYRPLYDRLSHRYDREASPRYFRRVVDWLIDHLPPEGRLLDVGCGTGRYALALADRGFTVTAVDESLGMIEQARAKAASPRVTFEVLDATLGLPEGPFDAILLIDAWEFLADPAKTLWHARQAVEPDGTVVIVTPHPGWRLPLTMAERLGVKRLAPAYGHRNGARRVIEVAALAGGFTLREMTSLYGTMARAALLAASDGEVRPRRRAPGDAPR
jgi:2-polyprenyl-3-methyl-5-hydroxy-6-metoxy-1,4-benzoquinol methylase